MAKKRVSRKKVIDLSWDEPQIELYYNFDEQIKKLKAQKDQVKSNIIHHLRKSGFKHATAGLYSVTWTSRGSRNFIGGYVAFVKEFGHDVARKWFKVYDSDQLKVTKRKPRK